MAELMPIAGIAQVSAFDIEYNDSLNELVDGMAHATEFGQPYWAATMSLAQMAVTDPRYLDWRSFLDRRRGAKKIAYFFDPRKPFPVMYRKGFDGLVIAGGSTPFVGVATLGSFADRRQINITGLPAGFQLKRTDLVEFAQSGFKSLHRLTADATANGSGQAQINVEPRVPNSMTTPTITFARPAFTGLIDGKISDSHDIERGTMSFSCRSIAEWAGGEIDTP